ncbi:MAG: ribosomal-processing cysteine protease Prp [Faecalimonas sp.]|nr:ribosomal-processing cysteine protease Prp [Faecalimonas sp.]
MTRITVYKNEWNEYVGFRADGHADYAEAGEDIVCAAISILTLNTVNAIETFTEDAFVADSDEELGYLAFQLLQRPKKEAALLLKTMVLGLEDIAKNYENYIDFTFEEV